MHAAAALAPAPSPAPADAPAGDVAGWRAALTLEFERRGERTVVARREHTGPLLVQRAFYPEGPDACHVYLLHPPGGVVGGDRLEVNATARVGAHALVTTPAAGKLYRSDGRVARQTTVLHVEADAALEWLPQETIAFAGARAHLDTRVELAAGARHIGWELLCLGRPAAGETFAAGEVLQTLELRQDGRPLLHERARYVGGAALLDAAWGLGGRPVTATLWAVAPRAGLGRTMLDAARAGLPEPPRGGLAAVTELNGVVVARCLAVHAEQARRWLQGVWALLRPAVLGRDACPPRIWST
jgi:urease accessory protein